MKYPSSILAHRTVLAQVSDLHPAFFAKETKDTLAYVAKDLGLHHYRWSIGSAWYGPVDAALAAAELTVEIGRVLLAGLFRRGLCADPNKPEDLDCKDVYGGEWPKFYEGVLLLYACNLALDHVIGPDLLNVGDGIQFDMPTAGRADICLTAHLHSYHSDERFSKFAMDTGKYNDYVSDPL